MSVNSNPMSNIVREQLRINSAPRTVTWIVYSNYCSSIFFFSSSYSTSSTFHKPYYGLGNSNSHHFICEPNSKTQIIVLAQSSKYAYTKRKCSILSLQNFPLPNTTKALHNKLLILKVTTHSFNLISLVWPMSQWDFSFFKRAMLIAFSFYIQPLFKNTTVLVKEATHKIWIWVRVHVWDMDTGMGNIKASPLIGRKEVANPKTEKANKL